MSTIPDSSGGDINAKVVFPVADSQTMESAGKSGTSALGAPTRNPVVSTKDPVLSKAHKVASSVLPMHVALLKMVTAGWLQLNDKELKGARDQFIGENTNMALVCALLFTTFIPLYYGEPGRVFVDGDGFQLDLTFGFLSRQVTLDISAIHDIFDTCYLIAACGMFYGTLTSVFFLLAANEAGTDERVIVLREHMGIFCFAPYYFFTIGAISWGLGVITHFVISPHTATGFIIVLIVFGILTIYMVVGAYVRMIQGLYLSFHEAATNPPQPRSREQIDTALDRYFGRLEDDPYCELDLDEFLAKLGPEPSARGFPVALKTSTRFDATRAFYKKFAKVKQIPYEEVLTLMAHRGGSKD